jgi:hypothetical protein
MGDRQIRRLGGRTGAILRGATPTVYPIMVAVVEYTTKEQSGELITPIDRKLVISTYKPDGTDLGIVPDPEQDKIVLYVRDTTNVESTLRLMAPPKLYDPHGTICLIEQQARFG